MRFEARNALVTGGGSGLGLACARRLAAEGATVTIAGRTEDRLRAAADELGGAVRIAVCDVADEASVASAVAVADEGDGLQIVVASAGVGWTDPISEVPLEAWQHVVDTNLTGTFLTLKHAVPRMQRAGGGTFVAISTAAASITMRFLSPYTATKAGVDHLVRTVADELGPSGIRVHSVQPGIVPTDINTDLQSLDEVTTSFMAETPIGRPGRPEEVAAAVCWLASDEATWLTGVVLPVDGGLHLRRGPSLDAFVKAKYPDGPTWWGVRA
jgi:NAD(P)-dependent dehydrogenase (short-subunit alcohol dehydrogenase family)